MSPRTGSREPLIRRTHSHTKTKLDPLPPHLQSQLRLLPRCGIRGQGQKKLKELLSIRQLFLFGVRAKIEKWKQSPPKPSQPTQHTATQQQPSEHAESPASEEQMFEDPSPQAPLSPTIMRKRTTSTISPPSALPTTGAKGKKKRRE